MEHSYLLHTVPVLMSYCSRGAVFGSYLNESVESHPILEHVYRVSDGHVTDTGHSDQRRGLPGSFGKRLFCLWRKLLEVGSSSVLYVEERVCCP